MTDPKKSSSRRILLNDQVLPWLLLTVLVVLVLSLGSFAYWRSSGAGPQVQVPMFYDAHYLFPRPWTQEQSAPGVPEPAPVAFYGENSASQSFIAGSDNLARIAFQLSGPEGELVKATLSGENGVFWQAEIPLAPGRNGDEYSLSFQPIPDARGQAYTLTLSAPQATAEQPVISYTVGGDRMGDSLRLNEFIRPGNLAITTYSKGAPGRWWFDALGEQLLPSIFRLRVQQYKPPEFKGSLFAWLLVVTVGLSVAMLVLANPTLQAGQSAIWRRLARASGWFLVLLLGSFLIWQVGSGRVILFTRSTNITAEALPAGSYIASGSGSRVVADLSSELWTAVREPEARFISTKTVLGYPAIRVPADSRIQYALNVPPDSRLRIASAAEGDGTIGFEVQVNDEPLFEREIAGVNILEPAAIAWQELDLTPWSGQGVVLSLAASSESGDAGGLWLMPQIVTDASWILAEPPAEYLPLEVQFGNTAELLGVQLDDATLLSEGLLSVQLLWRSLQESEQYGKVFVHLIDGNNQLVAQHDAPPIQGAYPFAVWQPGTIVRDEHVLQLDDEAITDGPYRLEIGVYDPDSLQRWTAENADGSTAESGVAKLNIPSEVLP